MLIDLASAGPPDGADPAGGDVAQADVCIIGAGAAGISLCRWLAAAGHRVTLLEAGGLDYDPATQALAGGANLGRPYYDLEDARLRFFGGTTNIWGGRCALLEPVDFEHRPWVPHSGWPIGFDDLAPHYRAVHAELGLGDFAYDESLWALLGQRPPDLGRSLISRFWRFDPVHERFNAARCDDLLKHDRVRVVTHANVTHLQAAANARALTQVRAESLSGRSLTVRARYFVLAAGGIENPRLLLAARDVETQGIGNSRDLVGRFFMEHQHGRAAVVDSRHAFRLWNTFRKRQPGGHPPLAPLLLPDPALQAERGILNTGLTFKLQRPPEQGLLVSDRVYRQLKHSLPPDRARRRLWHTYRGVRGALQRSVKPALERLRAAMGLRTLHVMVRAEPAPNPDSRVRLADQRDALGVPRAALDWRLQSQDKATVAALVETLDQAFRGAGLGRVAAADWLRESGAEWPVDETVGKHHIAGYHHMGTTRMSASPAGGVVDADCRVHGYGNLYVAGSSVFPTASWANPTLTLLALARRLSEDLDRRLKSP